MTPVAPLFAVDIDGTITADPALFAWLFRAIRQAGGTVAILTGAHGQTTVTPQDVQAKQSLLDQLGIGDYAQLVVFPDPEDGSIATAKSAWCEAHGAMVLIDNRKSTATSAAQGSCLVLVPWATRLK